MLPLEKRLSSTSTKESHDERSEMLILAIDPGETLGYVLVELTEYVGGSPTLEVIDANQFSLLRDTKQGFYWDSASSKVKDLLDLEPDVIVIEDYRVYASKALAHIGSRALTSELIGAICQEAGIAMIPVVRIPAGRKGLWPPARMKAKFTTDVPIPQPHAGDALILALIYAEDKGWKP